MTPSALDRAFPALADPAQRAMIEAACRRPPEAAILEPRFASAAGRP